MGSCCPQGQKEGSHERSPLLAGGGSRGQLSATVIDQPRSQISQRSKYTVPKEDENFPKHIDVLPVSIAEVDKRLQDHAHLFNEHLERWLALRREMLGIKEMYPEHNKDHSLKGAFKHIDDICRVLGDKCMNVKHLDNHWIFIDFDGAIIQQTAIPALQSFNKCSRLVKDILDKGPPLVSSVTMVVENEKEMRRELLVASLGADRPGLMNNCSENVSQLRRVPEYVEYIRRDTLKICEEMNQAVCALSSSNNAIV